MTMSDLYARLRNLFNAGVFKKRDKETVTVQTEFGRTLEAIEVFGAKTAALSLPAPIKRLS